jgi:hypothetical protein
VDGQVAEEAEERLARVRGVKQRLGLLAQVVEPPDENGLQQRRLGGEVSEDRADADPGQAGHLAGEPYALPAIFVLRVRNGEIVSSRDYHDHLASARVAGQLGELFAALSAQAAAPARTDAAP